MPAMDQTGGSYGEHEKETHVAARAAAKINATQLAGLAPHITARIVKRVTGTDHSQIGVAAFNSAI
jgi:hypothetical protein